MVSLYIQYTMDQLCLPMDLEEDIPQNHKQRLQTGFLKNEVEFGKPLPKDLDRDPMPNEPQIIRTY
jgi:hypothetical protein